MEIESALMARFVEYAQDGTLTIVGAGSGGFYVQPLPAPETIPGVPYPVVGTPVSAGLALQLSCTREEANAQHALAIRIADQTGKIVFDSGNQPIYQPRFVESSPALPLTFQLPAFCGFPPSSFGPYTVHLAIDGVEKKTVAFVVIAPPAGPR